jgi:hypothetical protein
MQVKQEITSQTKTKSERRTMKKAKKEMLDDLAAFQQVLAHPDYAKNPFQTISTHIENKMLLEALQTKN